MKKFELTNDANTGPTPRPPTINGNPSLRFREKEQIINTSIISIARLVPDFKDLQVFIPSLRPYLPTQIKYTSVQKIPGQPEPPEMMIISHPSMVMIHSLQALGRLGEPEEMHIIM